MSSRYPHESTVAFGIIVDLDAKQSRKTVYCNPCLGQRVPVPPCASSCSAPDLGVPPDCLGSDIKYEISSPGRW